MKCPETQFIEPQCFTIGNTDDVSFSERLRERQWRESTKDRNDSDGPRGKINYDKVS